MDQLGYNAPQDQDLQPLSSWEVIVPYWRQDVNIAADLVEEVARLYGYQQIPATPLQGDLPAKVDHRLFDFIYTLKVNLAAQGLDELQTYSFYSTQVLNGLKVNREELVKIANPMSKETEYLRNSLTPNLLEKVGENLKNFPQVNVFEIGKVYLIKDNTPEEKYRLAVCTADGSNNPLATHWKAVQSAFSQAGVTLELKEQPLIEEELFHPNRQAKLISQGQDVGFIAEIHPRILNRFGIEKRAALLEIYLDRLIHD